MAPRLFAEAPGESSGREHTRQAPRLKGLGGALGAGGRGAPGLALFGQRQVIKQLKLRNETCPSP